MELPASPHPPPPKSWEITISFCFSHTMCAFLGRFTSLFPFPHLSAPLPRCFWGAAKPGLGSPRPPAGVWGCRQRGAASRAAPTRTKADAAPVRLCSPPKKLVSPRLIPQPFPVSAPWGSDPPRNGKYGPKPVAQGWEVPFNGPKALVGGASGVLGAQSPPPGWCRVKGDGL